MKLPALRYIVVLVVIILEGTGRGNLMARNTTDLTAITAEEICHSGSDEDDHFYLEISSNCPRAVNQGEKVETVIVARTDSQHSRIKPVNLLSIIQSGVIIKERLSLRALVYLANPQTFHTRTLIKFLRV